MFRTWLRVALLAAAVALSTAFGSARALDLHARLLEAVTSHTPPNDGAAVEDVFVARLDHGRVVGARPTRNGDSLSRLRFRGVSLDALSALPNFFSIVPQAPSVVLGQRPPTRATWVSVLTTRLALMVFLN